MFLLDTCIISVLRRPDRAPASLVSWAADADAEDQFISVVTVLELEMGVLQAERSDTAKGAVLRPWLSSILRAFQDRIIAIDKDAALHCARLHVPDRRPERDALIAATALSRTLTVVTLNVRDFLPMGVPVLNPTDQER